MKTIFTYKDLIIWQRSMELVVEVYRLTTNFPKSEMYGLTSQMRRCAVSIPSNIAEGRRRSSRKEYRYFMTIAYGSGAELETQIEIVKRLPIGESLNFNLVDALLDEIMRMSNKTLSTLRN
ncbi:MAG: hypothetical protein CMI53_02165 [Parcubacteria group bacterium]|nr:hypothetical protein [Parcubacteria group bacterium]|tara:strand:+ start:424 stop:786 length:363 start_codon:yes stop_codon:yes gene_type:complete